MVIATQYKKNRFLQEISKNTPTFNIYFLYITTIFI